MGDITKIEWSDATWNPITGCDKVSQACKFCYAERDWERLSKNEKSVYFGRKFTDVQCHEDRLSIPGRWTKPRKIFVNSMSDLFHEDVPDEFIEKVYEVMLDNGRHTFQILTKRPERMAKLYHKWSLMSDLRGFNSCAPNIWVGVSVEDQRAFDERFPLLMSTNAAVKWLSIEPLLGPIELFDRECFDNTANYLKLSGLNWVVVGGESGPDARPMHTRWVRDIRNDCQRLNIPFLFKQWGEWAPKYPDAGPDDLRSCTMVRVGKKKAGRILDGITYDDYPE